MKALTWTGSWLATLAAVAVVVAFTWKRRLPMVAVGSVAAAWLGELLAATVAKLVVDRPRPPQAVWLVVARGWSFPSGHTANAVVVFATAAALVTTLLHSRNTRVLIWALAAVVIGLVGFSRVELGVHWTTDVVASILWTSWWILVVVKVLRRASCRASEVERWR
jgi:undecaprenyl-diphosphatase